MDWLKRIVLAVLMTFFIALSIELTALTIRSLFETLTSSVVAVVFYGVLLLFVLYVATTVDLEGGGSDD